MSTFCYYKDNIAQSHNPAKIKYVIVREKLNSFDTTLNEGGAYQISSVGRFPYFD